MEAAQMMTFGELARMLARSAQACKADLETDLAHVGMLAVPIAAEYIGHELPQWPPLAEATVREKERLGYAGQVSATDPRLRTGADRDSIKAEVDGLALIVGSARREFLYQEIGTAHIPPRPVLGPAMLASLDHAAERLGERGVKLTTPQGKTP